VVDLARFGKEKKYNIYPQLLDVHVPRLKEAFRISRTYINDSELMKSGLVKVSDFFGPALANRVYEEAMASLIRDGRKPGTMLKNRPDISIFTKDRLWDAVVDYFPERVRQRVSDHFEEHTYLQHLLNLPDDEDEQKVFHSDTFFPCVKFWYFPKAVTVNDGPFWYVPNSVELTPELIAWHEARVEDLKNDKAEAWRGQGHLEGSFRTCPGEIAELGLKPIPVTVEADTLVIANVFGFHKRGDVKEPKHRVSIHGSIRIEPFA
jgi:hypothetical protein